MWILILWLYQLIFLKKLFSRVAGFAAAFTPQHGARQVLCSAWFCVFAVVPAFKSPPGLVRIVVAVAHGTCVHQLFLSVDAVQFHDFFAWPC